MTIKILGSGCQNCLKLEENAKQAVKDLNLKDAKVEHIFEIEKIIQMGIMSTPALVIDDEVKITGRVAAPQEIKKIIQEIKK